MIGKMLIYSGKENILDRSLLTQTDDHELHHGTYIGQTILQSNSLSSESTIGEFFETVKLDNIHDISIELPARRGNAFVTHTKCKNCGIEFPVMRPLFTINASEYNRCDNCGVSQPDAVSKIEDLTINLIYQNSIHYMKDEGLLNLRLRDAGFAPLDIVPVYDGNSYQYIELTKDEQYMFPSWR